MSALISTFSQPRGRARHLLISVLLDTEEEVSVESESMVSAFRLFVALGS